MRTRFSLPPHPPPPTQSLRFRARRPLPRNGRPRHAISRGCRPWRRPTLPVLRSLGVSADIGGLPLQPRHNVRYYTHYNNIVCTTRGRYTQGIQEKDFPLWSRSRFGDRFFFFGVYCSGCFRFSRGSKVEKKYIASHGSGWVTALVGLLVQMVWFDVSY